VAGEFTRIAQFVSPFGPAASPRGPGDDCALVRVGRGRELCVTVDALVEDVHFTRAHFTPADIGHKALAVNLSDLAAMGATPHFALCAMGLPEWVQSAQLRGIARGMSALARASALPLVGGNLSRARELSLTITVAGEVPRGQALRRDTAKAGAWLYVGGTLGDAAAGLLLMQHLPSHDAARDERSGRPRGRTAQRGPGSAPSASSLALPTAAMRSLLRAQRRPAPQLQLGLLARSFASAAIDLSDGLIADVAHLARASGLRAILERPRLPTSPALRRGLREGWLPPSAQDLPLTGGEDYRLLLAIPPRRAAAFERALLRAGLSATRVGWLEAGAGVEVRDPTGTRLPASGGFDHFRRPDR